MNYIYDIVVNYNYPLFDFYEWNKEDNIKRIKKIPFYKVSSKDLNKLKHNKFKVTSLLKDIEDSTLMYKKNKKIKYSCILCDDNQAIAFLFNKNGICIGKSSLQIEQELEVLEYNFIMKERNIEYEIIGKDKINYYDTRNEQLLKTEIFNKINNMDNKDEKLNYLYYECFNKYPDKDPKEEFIYLFNTSKSEIYNKINNFFQLTSLNRK